MESFLFPVEKLRGNLTALGIKPTLSTVGIATVENLRTCRKAAGLTQEDVAALLRVTHQCVSLWEKGKRRPRPATLARIAAVLDVVA